MKVRQAISAFTMSNFIETFIAYETKISYPEVNT